MSKFKTIYILVDSQGEICSAFENKEAAIIDALNIGVDVEETRLYLEEEECQN